MSYSSIKRKKCKCSEDCNKFPTLGYGGYFSLHAPAEIKERVGTKKDVAKRNKNARNKASNLLHKDSEADKSKLMGMADKLFSNYIKSRDSDEQGIVWCICCGLPFSLAGKQSGSNFPIVETLHYISRGVYFLRYDEVNAAAGCCYCNTQMMLQPYGEAAMNYRKKLVNTIGEMKVIQMEERRRMINKLTVEDLKEVIEKYKPKE
jgi:hypothetical protein